MEFDPLFQPYRSNRYCVTARGGMVATGSNLAAAAGLELLRKGGNAVDAAIAAAAALTVVEPTSNGLGSDAFALVWAKDSLYGLNGSGRTPSAIDPDEIRRRCPDGKMPAYGWTPVTVPGAVGSWEALSRRFGRLPLADCLAPAIAYAEDGFPVTPGVAKYWALAAGRYKERFAGRHEFDEWFRVFTDGGRPYGFGETVRFPGHARTLRLIAEQGADAFYRGEIAEQFIRQSERDGGFFRAEDLANYSPEWVEPISVNYRGYDVWEIPPNGQGIVALMALNILKNFEFLERDCADTFHKQIEAVKLAFADALHYVTDPACMSANFRDFLRPSYGALRAAQIGEKAGLYTFSEPPKSGTVYLCTADGEGNMASFIQSNYMGFGSGIVLEGYGVSLQNRGADLSLDPSAANCLAPGKRSYHTIIPGFLTKDGRAVGPFGVMGGYMQPQGHVQAVMNMIDFGLNPQQALDAPRWRWNKEKDVSAETSFDKAVMEQLAARGHSIRIDEEPAGFGRGQIILRLENGVLVGGTDHRTDSSIASF